MVRLSRMLSIVLLAVHVTVGCCAPDAPACESKSPSLATQVGAFVRGQCRECACDPADHGPCKFPDCKYFLASKRRVVDSPFSQPIPASYGALARAHHPSLAVSCHGGPHGAGQVLLPVRLDLATQVLLI